MILHSAVDTADGVVESRAAEDLPDVSVCLQFEAQAFSLDSYPLDDVVLQNTQS